MFSASAMSSTGHKSIVHILALPNEMVRAIFSSLPVGVLLNVLLVCKRFYTVAQPIIFRSINIRIIPRAKPGCFEIKCMPETISRFSSVVSALSKNPTLRGNVESLSLDVWTHSFYEKFADQNILISLLPRLKFLQLQPPPVELDLSRHPLIQTLDLDFAGFGRNPNAAKSRDRCPSSLEFLSELLWHQSLRSLKASSLDLLEFDGGRFFPKERLKKSPINSISLRVCDGATVGALPQLLKSFEALQSFTLETSCTWEGEHMLVHGMAPRSICIALSHHATTLVELIIASTDGAWFPRTTLYGSLTQFVCLKRLGVPETFLANREDGKFDHLLPPSLCYLQLQYPMGFNQGYDEERPQRTQRLRCLLRNKDLNLPLLEKLVWWDQQPECWSGTTYGPSIDIFELGEMFRCNDVKFQYKNASYYIDTPLAGAPDPIDARQAFLDTGYLDDISCPWAGEKGMLGEEYDYGEWLDGHL